MSKEIKVVSYLDATYHRYECLKKKALIDKESMEGYKDDFKVVETKNSESSRTDYFKLTDDAFVSTYREKNTHNQYITGDMEYSILDKNGNFYVYEYREVDNVATRSKDLHVNLSYVDTKSKKFVSQEYNLDSKNDEKRASKDEVCQRCGELIKSISEDIEKLQKKQVKMSK